MKEEERRPDPRFSYAPTVTASERQADEYDRLRITMGPTWERLTRSQVGRAPRYGNVLVKEGIASGAL